jgi:hypothetical protein
MPRRWKMLVAASVGILILVGVFFAQSDNEPVYNGKKLSKWMVTTGPNRNYLAVTNNSDVTNAFAHLGTKAIPWLLDCVRAEASPTRIRLGYAVRNWTWLPDKWRGPSDSIIFQHLFGQNGFRILGTNGVSAIPELARILNRQDHQSSATVAGLALTYMGPAGLPPLISALSSTNPIIRICIISDLGSMRSLGTNTELVIEPLIRCLSDTNDWYYFASIKTLQALKCPPERFLPILTNHLSVTKPQGDILFTLDTLQRIGPDAHAAVPAIQAVIQLNPQQYTSAGTAALEAIAPELFPDEFAQ